MDVQVLVVAEFWEFSSTVEQRHRPGEIMMVSQAYLALYKPFLKELKPTKTVEKA